MRITALGYLLGALISLPAMANGNRWFEVEMIIFSREQSNQQLEQFDSSVRPIKPGRSIDLLSAGFQPDVLPLLSQLPQCDAQADNLTLPDIDYQFRPHFISGLCIFEQSPRSWQVNSLFSTPPYLLNVPYPLQAPTTPTGDGSHRNSPYLAPASALQLTDIAQRIQRQRNSMLLLHTAWRQAPVTERRAIASRWFAGHNFSSQFDYWGQPKNQVSAQHAVPYLAQEHTSDLISDIDNLLAQLNAGSKLPELPAEENKDAQPEQHTGGIPEQVWQLDGLFRLHLDHYLFVNTEFNLRRPANNRLESIYVKQSRRLISGEIHYLDHPYLGIILQIRRFDPATSE